MAARPDPFGGGQRAFQRSPAARRGSTHALRAGTAVLVDKSPLRRRRPRQVKWTNTWGYTTTTARVSGAGRRTTPRAILSRSRVFVRAHARKRGAGTESPGSSGCGGRGRAPGPGTCGRGGRDRGRALRGLDERDHCVRHQLDGDRGEEDTGDAGDQNRPGVPEDPVHDTCESHGDP